MSLQRCRSSQSPSLSSRFPLTYLDILCTFLLLYPFILFFQLTSVILCASVFRHYFLVSVSFYAIISKLLPTNDVISTSCHILYYRLFLICMHLTILSDSIVNILFCLFSDSGHIISLYKTLLFSKLYILFSVENIILPIIGKLVGRDRKQQ